MLEEPPNNAFFILVSHSSKRLLATIRSRCQQVNMECPDSEIGQRWLKQEGLSVSSQQLRYVGGSPLKAIQQEDYDDCMRLVKSLMDGRLMDISQAVNFCQSIGMAKSVDVLQKWLHDLLSTTNNLPARYHEISAEKLTTLAKQLELSRGFDLLDQLNYFRRHAQHPLNQELQFESICLNYTKILKKPHDAIEFCRLSLSFKFSWACRAITQHQGKHDEPSCWPRFVHLSEFTGLSSGARLS
jgi:DNA polymerase-3 subunit delta'